MRLIGVDVGGTFTDLILADTAAGTTHVHKVPTTDDPSIGVVNGIRELCGRAGFPVETLDRVLHGTTIATNAVLEYRGARTGMITTEGYRDVVHIGRHQRPQHYSIAQEVPWQDRPLVRRRHRKTVRERLVPPRGEVLVPLDEAGARTAARELGQAGVEAIAVCFLFSYLNSAHEERVRQIVTEELPGVFVTTSASIFPQFREFERFTTASINAFVGPVVKGYVANLSGSLAESGIGVELRIMSSNGGVVTAEGAAEKPVNLLLSGPAAGVLGGQRAGHASRRDHLITFDVGGTSADVGIVTPHGIPEASARDTWIGGYPVMVPMLDVHTIGAGGGSIAYMDAGGAFRVGPRSAGARPGPACYRLGGESPTVTDANVVLGRLSADRFLGGAMPLDPAEAERAVSRLATQLGLSHQEAAEGIVAIVNGNMAAAIRSRTVQKGHDPRRFALVAFGGAGPVHAAETAALLDIPEVIVPPHPGITSAAGLLTTDLKYDLIRTEFMTSTVVDLDQLNADVGRLTDQVRGLLAGDGVREAETQVIVSADCRYVGQGYELRVPVPAGVLDATKVDLIWEAFHARHEEEYGHRFTGSPIELVSLRVVGIGESPKLGRLAMTSGESLEAAMLERVDAYFRVGGNLEKLPTSYYDRFRLPVGTALTGPAVIFQTDSTTVVPPGWTATRDESGNLILEAVGTRPAFLPS